MAREMEEAQRTIKAQEEKKKVKASTHLTSFFKRRREAGKA